MRTIAIVLGIHLTAWVCRAAMFPVVYQTFTGSTVLEWGVRVPNGSRNVPLFATLRFNFNAAQPLLSAEITNAVLEGGDAFRLTVRSSSGSQWSDGTYTFTGDYLGEVNSSASQYLFDWRFSPSTNGQMTWNGTTDWAGGHAWYVVISNLTLVPVPWLTIERVDVAAAQVAWSTNFADHVLEFATGLPAVTWSPVTNAVSYAGDRASVTVDSSLSGLFYRLRKP
jgi:hypothetical protein